MTPGALLDAAYTKLCRAVGSVGGMVTRKRISREELLMAVAHTERALELMREALR